MSPIQGKYVIMGKPDWIEQLSMFANIIAYSSERKSAVLHAAAKPLDNYEIQFNIRNAAHVESSKMRKRILERRQKAIEDKVAKGNTEVEELEQIAQEIDAKKGTKEKGRYVTKYCMSRLLICPYCGGFYKRTTWLEKGGKIGVWRCKNRMEGKACPKSSSYHEDVLQKAVLTAVNSMIGRLKEVDGCAQKSSKKTLAQIGNIESRIKEINDKLATIETERDTILTNISGSMFEQMSDELKALNNQESEYACQLEELRQQQNTHRRNLLREESARKLLKDLKPLTEFDDNILGRILAKVEAVGKDKITVTFCGGYTITQILK